MGQKTLVVGAGLTGQSVMRYLAQHNQAFDIYDTREQLSLEKDLPNRYPQSQLWLGKNVEQIPWFDYYQVVVSPGLSPKTEVLKLAAAHQLPIIGDLELFARHNLKQPVIAITGTNGKTTVTSLVAHILKHAGLSVAVAGNIGEPMLDVLCQKPEQYDVWVLELSSFQLHYQHSFKPSVSGILNVSEDHLDWHGSFDAYCQAKQKIYQAAQIKVFNLEDKYTYPKDLNGSKTFGITDIANFYFKDSAFFQTQQRLFNYEGIPLTGQHNIQNILAAIAFIGDFGIAPNQIKQALNNFQGLAHRSQQIRMLEGVNWVNDSKGTNVGATLAAIKGIGADLRGKIIWLAGGVSKGSDFSPLSSAISRYGRCAILFGRDRKLIAQHLAEDMPRYFVDSLHEAVMLAKKQAKAKDCVLLSPACASFDMFENYIKRGEQFSQLVKELS